MFKIFKLKQWGILTGVPRLLVNQYLRDVHINIVRSIKMFFTWFSVRPAIQPACSTRAETESHNTLRVLNAEFSEIY